MHSYYIIYNEIHSERKQKRSLRSSVSRHRTIRMWEYITKRNNIRRSNYARIYQQRIGLSFDGINMFEENSLSPRKTTDTVVIEEQGNTDNNVTAAVG